MSPELRGRLLSWYRSSRRPLPWRRNPTPYRVWVSEIMLQQTTVAAAAPRYVEFMRRFPSLKSLASAREADVLKAWAGLGYYARARNLRKAARLILAERGGSFPDDPGGVGGLPGVGRYTAGAILSIAFQKKAAVLDGNVMRVLARFYAIRENVKSSATQERLWALAENLVPPSRPGDWNQALMELGATVCLPESPLCGACPLAAGCAARRRGLQERLPETGKRREPVALQWKCLWIETGGKVLLWRRSDAERFLKGHWGLPEERHVPAAAGRLLKTVRHSITHHKIAVEVREAALTGAPGPCARWVERGKLRDHLVSSLWLKTAGLAA